jgi:hypothetical protein
MILFCFLSVVFLISLEVDLFALLSLVAAPDSLLMDSLAEIHCTLILPIPFLDIPAPS